MPKPKYGEGYLDVSTFHIKSADYFRLKNISLGYTFNLKNVMKARVYVAGQNLLTFTPFRELIRKCPELALQLRILKLVLIQLV